MKKILLVLTLFIMTALTLTACQVNDGTPEGMQTVYGSDIDGYYFYGPEEWVVANVGDIKCTYVSTVDYTSATFVKSNLPSVSIPELSEEARVKEYFLNSIERLNSEPFSNFSLSDVNGESCDFGNADSAYKFVYSYTYGEKPYKTMQILLFKGEDFYIFTYNSSAQEYSQEEGSYYQFYLKNKIQPIIENFKFVNKSGAAEEVKQYDKDENGNIIVSDKSKADFTLTVSEEYTPDYSEGMVSVTHKDGANITVSKLIDSTISIKDNYLQRKDKLKALSDKADDGRALFEEIKGVKVDENGDESLHIIELSNARSAALFEYKYTIFGEEYYVYQVFIVVGHLDMKAYVFTLTCPIGQETVRRAEAMDILGRMEF